MKDKKYFEGLLGRGKIQELIHEWLDVLKQIGEDDLYENILLISSRFLRNEEKARKQTISEADYNLELNKITNSIQDYLKEFRVSNSNFSTPHTDKNIKLLTSLEIIKNYTDKIQYKCEKIGKSYDNGEILITFEERLENIEIKEESGYFKIKLNHRSSYIKIGKGFFSNNISIYEESDLYVSGNFSNIESIEKDKAFLCMTHVCERMTFNTINGRNSLLFEKKGLKKTYANSKIIETKTLDESKESNVFCLFCYPDQNYFIRMIESFSYLIKHYK